jgi:hypothetical protein
VTLHRYIPITVMIARRALRGIAFIILGGTLIFAFMMRSTNWDRYSLEKVVSGEGQDQSTNSR